MKPLNSLFKLSILTCIIISFSGIKVNAQAEFSKEKDVQHQTLTYHDASKSENVTFEGLIGPDYGRIRSIAFDTENENMAYSSSMDGRHIFESSDSGQNWSPIYAAPQVAGWGTTVDNLKFANPNEPNHLYFSVTTSKEGDSDIRGIYILDVSTGEVVEVIQIFEIHHLNISDYDIDPNDPDNIVILGTLGVWFTSGSQRTVWTTSDGGDSWDLIFDFEDYERHSPGTVNFHQNDPNTVLIGMRGSPEEVEGGFYKTTDGGDNWTLIQEGDIIREVEVSPDDPDLFYAVTGMGADEDKVLRSNDGGESWTTLDCELATTMGPNNFVSVAIDPSNTSNIWVTTRYEVIHSDDGGETFESTVFEQDDYHTLNYGHAIGINPFDSNHVIVGSDHRIVQTFDKGENWELKASPKLSINMLDATKYPNDDVVLYYTAQGSYFAHNLQTGEVNEDVGLNMVGVYYYIFGDEYTQDRAFKGRPGGFLGGITIFKSDDHFATEPTEVYQDNQAGLLRTIVRAPDDEDTYWFVTPLNNFQGPGKLVRTTDGFETTEVLSITGEDMEVITTLEVVEGQPGVLWAYAAGMENEGIYKSEDSGDTWELYSNGLPEEVGIWDIAVNQNNPDNLVATVSMDHGIYVTDDGGENWVPAFTDYECIQVIFSKEHEDVVFARPFIFAGLLFSEDGGRTWTEVSDEIILDATYADMDIVDNEESIDIYMTGSGINIAKYNFTKTELYTVNFLIKDDDDNEITDAVVTFNGIVNEPGDYTFDEIESGTYIYNVEKDGYLTVEDEITVNEDTTIEVKLFEKTYTVTFEIADSEGHEISQAVIKFDGLEYEPGHYVFESLEPGTYSYKVTKENYFPVEDVVNVDDEDKTVNIEMQVDDTFAESHQTEEISIFPNPANDRIYINSSDNIKKVNLIEINGRVVISKNINESDSELNLSNLNPGIYFIKVHTSDNITTKKVIISR